MKKMLLDANIIVAILFEGDARHEEAYTAARIAANKFKVLLTPATFVICNYYIEKDFKKHRNKATRDRLLNSLFHFDYCTEDDSIMRMVQRSKFHDKEDALQYYSALQAGVEVLMTYNTHDFYPYSKDMMIYNPIEFLVSYS